MSMTFLRKIKYHSSSKFEFTVLKCTKVVEEFIEEL